MLSKIAFSDWLSCNTRLNVIGCLHDPVTWYKITHAGAHVAQWDFQNKATRTSPPWPAFVLEVPRCNLRYSMCDFVQCNRIVQKAYSTKFFWNTVTVRLEFSSKLMPASCFINFLDDRVHWQKNFSAMAPLGKHCIALLGKHAFPNSNFWNITNVWNIHTLSNYLACYLPTFVRTAERTSFAFFTKTCLGDFWGLLRLPKWIKFVKL